MVKSRSFKDKSKTPHYTTKYFCKSSKEHRERTLQVLKVAKANNWQRQVQINEAVLESLNNIISELEQD